MSDLSDLAAQILKACEDNFPGVDQRLQQTLCLSEEAGEAVGAIRRYLGMARRTGSFDDVRAEVADTVITAYVVAAALEFDLDQAINDKAAIVLSRGWRQQP